MYPTIQQAKDDDFSKLEDYQFIKFTPATSSMVTDVHFFNIGDLTSSIGGFNSFMKTLFGMFLFLLFRMFIKSLAQTIKESYPRDLNTKVEDIVIKIKERLSYLGVYSLYDRV